MASPFNSLLKVSIALYHLYNSVDKLVCVYMYVQVVLINTNTLRRQIAIEHNPFSSFVCFAVKNNVIVNQS